MIVMNPIRSKMMLIAQRHDVSVLISIFPIAGAKDDVVHLDDSYLATDVAMAHVSCDC